MVFCDICMCTSILCQTKTVKSISVNEKITILQIKISYEIIFKQNIIYCKWQHYHIMGSLLTITFSWISAFYLIVVTLISIKFLFFIFISVLDGGRITLVDELYKMSNNISMHWHNENVMLIIINKVFIKSSFYCLKKVQKSLHPKYYQN